MLVLYILVAVKEEKWPVCTFLVRLALWSDFCSDTTAIWCVNQQDSRISVEAMLQSPYVGDIRSEAEEWCAALKEIEEITDLWTVCQKKVKKCLTFWWYA